MVGGRDQGQSMPFVKGQSGNPLGRPAIPAKVRILLRKTAPEAIKTIIELSKTSSDDRVRIKAAEILCDRAWGRTPQAVELSGSNGGPIAIDHNVSPELGDALALARETYLARVMDLPTQADAMLPIEVIRDVG